MQKQTVLQIGTLSANILTMSKPNIKLHKFQNSLCRKRFEFLHRKIRNSQDIPTDMVPSFQLVSINEEPQVFTYHISCTVDLLL